MGKGIDIYRYQTVTDWAKVKKSGVSFVYVKGTDGGGPAIVRADGQVNGALRVDLPVGLYHYAQLSPSPETQANVLTAETKRLKAFGLPPCLDLELPHRAGPAAEDFARRFLRQLRANRFEYVCLYANTSMLTGINAERLRAEFAGRLIIWAASYGPNDGKRHPLHYGRADIHQYTSVGGVPGISGLVDLNESLTALPRAYGAERTDQMDTTQSAKLDDVHTGMARLLTEFYNTDQAYGKKTILDRTKDIDDRTAAGTPVTLSNEDRAAIIKGVQDGMSKAIAVAVADEFDRRARDNDPNTGPTS